MSAKVKPIPDGYRSVTPYLMIQGAGEAIDFYKKAFGARERMRVPGPGGKIMHAEIEIGDSALMLAEEFADMGALAPTSIGGTPVGIHLYVDNVDETFKTALAAGAKEEMPVKNQFYGDRSGSLIDPFGHKWHVATHVEDVSPAELDSRMQEWKKSGQC